MAMIAIGADHAGVRLKAEIAEYLRSRGIAVEDVGTFDETSTDYPDYAEKVGRLVVDGVADRGILICGTGIGVSISANKIAGIRAALCSETFSARMSREHNDANVLCLGARVVGGGVALDIVGSWLEAAFAGGRHQRRVDKIGALERGALAR
ncbi:MAG: ribose 5-phosphate isomerase B [Chloroflexota bacterium]|nr:MAG: ribose 5-phosphate isomerase B [Chloroflexota bacterium]